MSTPIQFIQKLRQPSIKLIIRASRGRRTPQSHTTESLQKNWIPFGKSRSVEAPDAPLRINFSLPRTDHLFTRRCLAFFLPLLTPKYLRLNRIFGRVYCAKLPQNAIEHGALRLSPFSGEPTLLAAGIVSAMILYSRPFSRVGMTAFLFFVAHRTVAYLCVPHREPQRIFSPLPLSD